MAVKLVATKKSANGGQVITKINDAFKASAKNYVEEKRKRLEAINLIPVIDKSTFPGIKATTTIVEIPRLGFTIKSIQRSFERGKNLPRIVFGRAMITKRLAWFGGEIVLDRQMEDEIKNGEVVPVSITNSLVRVISEDQNSFLMTGDSELGLEGLSNVTGSRVYIVSATGINNEGAAATEWKWKTGVQLVEDILEAVEEFEIDKKYKVDTIGLSPKFLALLKRKRLENNVTALVDLKAQLPNVEIGENIDLIDNNGMPTIVLLEKKAENFGVIQAEPIKNTKNYTDGPDSVQIFEGKLSEIIATNPEAIMFLEGVI